MTSSAYSLKSRFIYKKKRGEKAYVKTGLKVRKLFVVIFVTAFENRRDLFAGHRDELKKS